MIDRLAASGLDTRTAVVSVAKGLVATLESVTLLARALEHAGLAAPVTEALGRLISGELPLDKWVTLVRATVPPPALAGTPPTRTLAAGLGEAVRQRRVTLAPRVSPNPVQTHA